MGRRFLYLALAMLLTLGLTGCNIHDEEAERTPDVEFYIEYASERYGVPVEDISVVAFEKATSWSYGRGKYPVEPVVCLEWNGKEVIFAYTSIKDYYDTTRLRDDYYFDELYEGVREYYMTNLDLDDVIVVPGSSGRSSSSSTGAGSCHLYYGYGGYLLTHNLSEVNDSVIEDFVGRMGEVTKIYVELEGEDPEAEVRALIDKLKQIDCRYTVRAMTSLSVLNVYRAPLEDGYQGIPPLCLDYYDSRECLYAIEPEDQCNWDDLGAFHYDYEGYSYRPVRQLILEREANALAETDEASPADEMEELNNPAETDDANSTDE